MGATNTQANADILMKQNHSGAGYGAPVPKPKEEMKTMAMAGTGIMNSQIPTQAKAYYGAGAGVGGVPATNGVSAGGNYDSTKPSDVTGVGANGAARGTTNLGVSPQKVDQYNS